MTTHPHNDRLRGARREQMRLAESIAATIAAELAPSLQSVMADELSLTLGLPPSEHLAADELSVRARPGQEQERDCALARLQTVVEQELQGDVQVSIEALSRYVASRTLLSGDSSTSSGAVPLTTRSRRWRDDLVQTLVRETDVPEEMLITILRELVQIGRRVPLLGRFVEAPSGLAAQPDAGDVQHWRTIEMIKQERAQAATDSLLRPPTPSMQRPDIGSFEPAGDPRTEDLNVRGEGHR